MTAIRFKDLEIGETFKLSPSDDGYLVARRINVRESSLTTRGFVNAEDMTTGFVFYLDGTRNVWRCEANQ